MTIGIGDAGRADPEETLFEVDVGCVEDAFEGDVCCVGDAG
jgi:hypothetical protein